MNVPYNLLKKKSICFPSIGHINQPDAAVRAAAESRPC